MALGAVGGMTSPMPPSSGHWVPGLCQEALAIGAAVRALGLGGGLTQRGLGFPLGEQTGCCPAGKAVTQFTLFQSCSGRAVGHAPLSL